MQKAWFVFVGLAILIFAIVWQIYGLEGLDLTIRRVIEEFPIATTFLIVVSVSIIFRLRWKGFKKSGDDSDMASVIWVGLMLLGSLLAFVVAILGS